MLVVKVFVHPFGDASQEREIGSIEISNMGGDDVDGLYDAIVEEDGVTVRRVKDLWHRRSRGALALVSAVLEKAL